MCKNPQSTRLSMIVKLKVDSHQLSPSHPVPPYRANIYFLPRNQQPRFTAPQLHHPIDGNKREGHSVQWAPRMKLGFGTALHFWCFLISLQSPGDKNSHKKPVFLTACLIQEAREGKLFRDLKDFASSPRKTWLPFKRDFPFSLYIYISFFFFF